MVSVIGFIICSLIAPTINPPIFSKVFLILLPKSFIAFANGSIANSIGAIILSIKKSLVSNANSIAPCLNGVSNSAFNILANLPNIPADLVPSSFSLPNSHSLNPPCDALIDKAKPAIAPPIGPKGVAIAPRNPILPIRAADR